MKKLILILSSCLLFFVAAAQNHIDEKGFSYQGYARLLMWMLQLGLPLR